MRRAGIHAAHGECTRTSSPRTRPSARDGLPAAHPSLHGGTCTRALAGPLRLQSLHRLDAGAGSDPQGRGWWHNPDTPTPQDPGCCSSHAQQASVATWRVGQGTSLSFPLQMMAGVVPAEDEDGRPHPSRTLGPRISPAPLSARTPPTPGSAAVLAGLGEYKVRRRVRGDRPTQSACWDLSPWPSELYRTCHSRCAQRHLPLVPSVGPCPSLSPGSSPSPIMPSKPLPLSLCSHCSPSRNHFPLRPAFPGPPLPSGRGWSGPLGTRSHHLPPPEGKEAVTHPGPARQLEDGVRAWHAHSWPGARHSAPQVPGRPSSLPHSGEGEPATQGTQNPKPAFGHHPVAQQ